MHDAIFGAAGMAAIFAMMGIAYFVGGMRGAATLRQTADDHLAAAVKAEAALAALQREKPPDPAPVVETEDDRLQREKAAALRKAFLDMMAYNEHKATKGG